MEQRFAGKCAEIVDSEAEGLDERIPAGHVIQPLMEQFKLCGRTNVMMYTPCRDCMLWLVENIEERLLGEYAADGSLAKAIDTSLNMLWLRDVSLLSSVQCILVDVGQIRGCSVPTHERLELHGVTPVRHVP